MFTPNYNNPKGVYVEVTATNPHSHTRMRVTSEDGVIVTLPPGDRVTFPFFLAEGLQLICNEDYIQDNGKKIPRKSFVSIDKDAYHP